MDVYREGKGTRGSGVRDVEIQRLRVAVRQVPMGRAKREWDIGWRGAAPRYEPCQEQPDSRKKKWWASSSSSRLSARVDRVFRQAGKAIGLRQLPCVRVHWARWLGQQAHTTVHSLALDGHQPLATLMKRTRQPSVTSLPQYPPCAQPRGMQGSNGPITRYRLASRGFRPIGCRLPSGTSLAPGLSPWCLIETLSRPCG